VRVSVISAEYAMDVTSAAASAHSIFSKEAD
jgi:hypothetical protein